MNRPSNHAVNTHIQRQEKVKKIAVLQSAYIPWRGYFDMIAAVDAFILYDDVQFSNGDWRNRNRILTTSGPKWITIPVPKKSRVRTNICDIQLVNADWQLEHWNRLKANYGQSRFFNEIEALLRPVYETNFMRLSDVNYGFLTAICHYLGITTPLSWSSDYALCNGKTERLVDLVQQVGGNIYVSGPAAKDYLEVSRFEEKGISVEWFSYNKLKNYPQKSAAFEGAVSIVDLLFNCGPASREFLPNLRT